MVSIVSNSYYGMPRGQIHINLPPEHPIMSFETIEIKMAAVSAKRSIRPKVSFNEVLVYFAGFFFFFFKPLLTKHILQLQNLKLKESI